MPKKVIRDLVPGEPPLPKRSLVRMPARVGLAAYARFAGGKAGLIELARLSEDEKLRRIVAAWDNLSPRERLGTRIEDLLAKVGLSSSKFLGAVVTAGHDHCVDLSKFMLAVSQPKLTEKLVEFAMMPEHAKHMEMALKAAGRFPTPEGTSVNLFQSFRGEPQPPPQAPPPAPGLASFEEQAIIDADFRPVEK